MSVIMVQSKFKAEGVADVEGGDEMTSPSMLLRSKRSGTPRPPPENGGGRRGEKGTRSSWKPPSGRGLSRPSSST